MYYLHSMVKANLTILFVAVVGVIACRKGKHNDEACNGDTRRELKVLIDDKVNEIDFISDTITITELGKMEVPEVKSETLRQNVEMKLYTVRAKVDKISKERDGDYHIRLIENDNYLITESVNPGCSYAQKSSYLMRYEEVRHFIKNNNIEGKTVTITGVSFVDIDHYYKRKQAPNNIELHPIIAISF